MKLTEEDREIVLDALEHIDGTPPPRDFGPFGPPLAIAGVAMLALTPILGARVALPRTAAVGLLVAGAALLVVGLILALTAGGIERGAAGAAAEAALRQLESGEDDREIQLRAATLLVVHAFQRVTSGVTASFDPAEGARRVGAAMPLVQAVEAELVARGRAEPLFTTGPTLAIDSGPEPGA